MTDSRIRSASDGTLEIDVFELLKAFIRKLWVILLVAAILASGAFVYTATVIAPTYESYAKVYVNNSGINVGSSNVSISSSSLSAAQALVDTYIVILKSNSTLEKVIEEANLRDENGDYITCDSLRGRISASSVDSTEIFEITVRDSDPYRSMRIVNTITQVLPYQISAIVNGSSVKTVDPGDLGVRVGPSFTKNTALGFIAGAFIVMVVIAIKTLTDQSVHDEKYLIDTYQLPLLAVVPDLRRHSGRGYYKKHGSYTYGSGRSRYAYYAKPNTTNNDEANKGGKNG